jgi:type II secretion system protein G
MRGFTLIELLIVVAIIAILAAIAVPNFLEAQTRAKVSRVRADLRSIATAVEAYAVDYNGYPVDWAPLGVPKPLFASTWMGEHVEFVALTTPVAYMTGVPDDPFFEGYQLGIPTERSYAYGATQGPFAIFAALFNVHWILSSRGPDRHLDIDDFRTGERVFNPLDPPDIVSGASDLFYDPTNGTISVGDVHRIQIDPSL